MSVAAIKKIDKAKNDLLKKVDVLVAKKKKLYSNMDITSAKSAEEKKLDKEISDLFSKINALVVEKRKLTNFGSMPIKKKTTATKKPAALGPKAKLMKLTIPALRKKAKALNVSDYTKRTKENLVQSIILGEARKNIGKVAKKKAAPKTSAASRQTKMRERDIVKDLVRKAKAPGKRRSASGKIYYERRANRSDVPGTMLGEYNGWRNYETWLTNVYYDDFIADYIQDAVEQGETSVYRIGQSLKEYFEEMLYDAGDMPQNTFLQDLINAGLSEISWRELVLNAGSNFDLKD